MAGKPKIAPRSRSRKNPRCRSCSGVGSGLDSQQWLTYLDKYASDVQELMTLTPQKRQFYQRGMRAISRI